MLLAFDVGNSHTVVGLINTVDGSIIDSSRVMTNKKMTSDEMGILLVQLFSFHGLALDSIEAVIVSSVVPELMYTISNMVYKYFNKKPLVVGDDLEIGLKTKFEYPKELGADRIVNAVAAIKRYGGPLIIIDLGTATTFCAINENNTYLGGAIMPGIKISADALTDATSKLTRVELERPESVICRNTVSSIQSGLIYGSIGAVDYIVESMKTELNTDKEIKVIATGGMSTLIANDSKTITHVDKTLTLNGLYDIYILNR